MLNLWYSSLAQVEKDRSLLEKCAATALSSKLIHQQKEFFAKMVVDAVLMLDDLLPLNMIGIKQVQGGALEVIYLPNDLPYLNLQCELSSY